MARVKDLWVLSILVAAAAAVSCSSSKKRETTNPYGTETQFCQAWAKNACNSKVVAACGAKDTESCIARQSSYCLGLVPPNYDPTNAKICLDAVQKAYSDAKLTAEEVKLIRELSGDCSQLNAGPKAVGDACSADDECNNVQGVYCVKKGIDPQGTCQVPIYQPGGYSCAGADQTCAEGFYCDGTNCLARPGDGQECNTETKPCLEDYNCLGTGPYYCSPKGDISASCATDNDCKSGICAKPATGVGSCKEEVVLSGFDPFCPNLS